MQAVEKRYFMKLQTAQRKGLLKLETVNNLRQEMRFAVQCTDRDIRKQWAIGSKVILGQHVINKEELA